MGATLVNARLEKGKELLEKKRDEFKKKMQDLQAEIIQLRKDLSIAQSNISNTNTTNTKDSTIDITLHKYGGKLYISPTDSINYVRWCIEHDTTQSIERIVK